LSVSVNQEYFVAGGSQGLEQEHPEMRHEVAGHAVVRVVQQNLQSRASISQRNWIA